MEERGESCEAVRGRRPVRDASLFTVSKISIVPSGIGSRWRQSTSSFRQSLTCVVNASVSLSANECIPCLLARDDTSFGLPPPAAPGRRPTVRFSPCRRATAAIALFVWPAAIFHRAAGLESCTETRRGVPSS